MIRKNYFVLNFNLNLPFVGAVKYGKTFKDIANNYANYSDPKRYLKIAAL